MWLVARRSKDHHPFPYGFNDLMAFKIEHKHTPAYGVKIEVPSFAHGEHVEDPRCVSFNGTLWISACNFVVFGGGQTWSGAHQIIFDVGKDWRAIHRYDPVYGQNGSHTLHNRGDEKNWLWVWIDGLPHLIYQTFPMVVVKFNSVFRATAVFETRGMHPEWVYGQPRGGTPPVRVDNEYWTFFHSSIPWRGKKRRYFMGALAFDAASPFRITRMTPRPILVGSQHDYWCEGKPLVTFPCGAILRAGEWIISLGVNDLKSAWMDVMHKDIVALTEPVLEGQGPPEAIAPTLTTPTAPSEEAIFI